MTDTAPKPRPQFRNISVPQILSYRLPLFAASVTSQASFDTVAGYVGHPLVKLVLLALIWGYLHHFCAGIRYLMLDLHIGIDKEQSKTSAAVVFGASLTLTLVFALKLFGVW